MRPTPRVVLTILLFMLCGGTLAQQPDASPIDPQSTSSARLLLKQIEAVSGKGLITGQHNFPNRVSEFSDRVMELTGAYPGVFGQDFGFSDADDKDSVLGRPAMIQEVIRQYRKGSIIALTWHAVRPTDEEPVGFRESVQGHLTDFEWQQLLTPGTELHARWERQVDRIAGYLRELQDAGVPVLFRPYHEMNGNWFWWGGRPGPGGSQELYRQLQERYLRVHQLHNLVWVWNVNAPSVNAGEITQYFPGSAFADIFTMDIYGPYEQTFYDSMVELAGAHKAIALAEVGKLPSAATLAQQPRWTYFMMWSGMAETANTPGQLVNTFQSRNMISRGDPRLGVQLSNRSFDQTPIDVLAAVSARNTLTRLHSSASEIAASDVSLIDVDGTSAKDLRAKLQRLVEEKKVPLVRWKPPSPTGSNVALSDFEWSELIRPGSTLRATWLQEIRAFASGLAEAAGPTVLLLDPLPHANEPSDWWSAHPGPTGSQLLVSDVQAEFSRINTHTLLWVWEPKLTSSAANRDRSASLASYFPGPGYTDIVFLSDKADTLQHGYAERALVTLIGPKLLLRVPTK